MPKYTAMINDTWPDGEIERNLGPWYSIKEARSAVEGELDRLYPGKWARCNDTQYAAIGAYAGQKVMAVFYEDLTEREGVERAIAQEINGIMLLEKELTQRREHLAALSKRWQRIVSEEA
jgi:hypothetical protein